MIWWSIFVLSLALNVFSILYIRWLLGALTHTSDGLDGIWEIVTGYTEHVKTINQLEMFYGDETLASLISHGKEMTSTLEEYRAVYQVFEEDERSSLGEEAQEE